MTPEQAIVTAFVTIIIVLALVAIFCMIWAMIIRAKSNRAGSPTMDIQRENMRNLHGDNTD